MLSLNLVSFFSCINVSSDLNTLYVKSKLGEKLSSSIVENLNTLYVKSKQSIKSSNRNEWYI